MRGWLLDDGLLHGKQYIAKMAGLPAASLQGLVHRCVEITAGAKLQALYQLQLTSSSQLL